MVIWLVAVVEHVSVMFMGMYSVVGCTMVTI